MTVKRDYYEVLSVTRTADGDEIKKAYRKLAMQYHPDRNHGDAEAADKFKECTEAFEVLSVSEKRHIYDRHGHAGLNGMGGHQSHGVDLGDLLGGLFGDFFGGQQQRRRGGPQPGRDVQVVLDIELAEAATGVKKTLTVQREDACEPCGGSGAKPGTKPAACKRCGGQGVTVQRQGPFQVQQPCRGCGGQGMVITDPCAACKGHGRVVGRKPIEVDIPAGVDTGDRIRFQGYGDAGGPGAPRGDLEFAIRVREHPVFQRDGHNLIRQWTVTFSQAALGGPVEVPTLTGGSVTHVLPRGTQTHAVVRLPGHGLPDRRRPGRVGELLVQIVVGTPQNLTAEQEHLFHRLAELDRQQAAAPPAKKGLFGKLKDFVTPDE